MASFDYESYQTFVSPAVNFNRQQYGPLDVSQLFLSEADLKWYCSNGTDTSAQVSADTTTWKATTIYPYPGQIVALRDSETKTVRILKLTEQLSAGEVVIVDGKPQFEYSDIGVDESLCSQVQANTELLNILTGNSVSSISSQIEIEVAKIVDSAPPAFDTLKEIADWICSDTSGAVVLVNQVSQAEANILTLSGGLSGLSVNLTSNYATKKYVHDISSALSTSVDSTVSSVSSTLNAQLTDITKNYATKAEVNTVSGLLSDEIDALDGRIGTYEAVITVNNGVVQISTLSVSNISGTNSDFVVSNVSAENVDIQSTSALTFTTEGKTLAEILNGLSADAGSKLSSIQINGAVLTGTSPNILIATGAANGTIKVNNVDVPVKGLDTAAYTPASAYVQLTAYNQQITTLTSAIKALNEHQTEYESVISIDNNDVVQISSLSVTNISSTNAEFTATSVYTDNLQIKDLSTVTIANKNQTLEAILAALSADLSSAIITNDLTWKELP